MRGDLAGTSIPALCRRLGAAQATGTLELERGDERGAIAFHEGRVGGASSPAPHPRLGERLVHADIITREQLVETLRAQAGRTDAARLGELLVERGIVTDDVVRVFVVDQVLDAVLELVAWREGTYTFTPEITDVAALRVDLSVDHLLVEVGRRQREWEEIGEVIPDLDVVPEFVAPESSPETPPLEPDELAILASVDGRRSVRELADDLGFGTFEAARILYGLTLLGIVGLRAPDAPRAVPPLTLTAEMDLDRLDVQAGGESGDASDAAQHGSSVADEPTPTPPAPAPVGGDDEDEPEPELWVAQSAEPTASERSAPDERVRSMAELDDDEFDRFIDQLSSGPAPQPPAPGTTERRQDPADVSEFLRELSRLALDEREHPEDADGAAGAADRAAEAARERRAGSGRTPPDGEDGRRRGLFGRGR